MTRVRVRFTKHGKVRFTSHRDTARIWERALRKASIEVAYSEGFSPRPKLHFGLALPTGYESDAEYLDVDLAGAAGVDEITTFPDRLTTALPIGMAATAAETLEPGAPSLQQAVTVCGWRVAVPGLGRDDLVATVERALAATELFVTRTRKGVETTDDVRPCIAALDVGSTTDHGTELIAELGTQPRALRPAELLAALDPAPTEGLVTRTHQWIEHDGERREPLVATRPAEVGAVAPSAPARPEAPHATARAS
ncbi:MAG TPA: TIGR03936 family radical SAM-associated protein [Acidimicrobiales bacterium]|jgi:radical SAM-linked protein|nr:TIGR03936 family radical SAM-associated protein [Acidimicrobiales bacterium]